ncbi:MAG: pyroglutamyl-peptidase I [Christensenellaceae bacterium]|nr:pyroglutamyl-peptidase I [Christensenellaceae bacterium]
MEILISGFEGFGGESTNPSADVLNFIPDQFDNIIISKIVLPVTFSGSFNVLKPNIAGKSHVIMLGQAGGSDAIRLEKTAVNLINCKIADNEGNLIKNKTIISNGPNSYNSTLPIDNMLNALFAKGIRAQISKSAGEFVCNYIFYNCMHYIVENNISAKAGFIHLPYEEQQVIGKNKAFMPVETMVEALLTIINLLKN